MAEVGCPRALPRVAGGGAKALGEQENSIVPLAYSAPRDRRTRRLRITRPLFSSVLYSGRLQVIAVAPLTQG
jgi:hypothetical protein